MKLSTLFDKISNLGCKWVYQLPSDMDICTFALIQNTTIYHPATLYLGTTSDLMLLHADSLSPDSIQNVSFLCVPNCSPLLFLQDFENNFFNRANLILTPETCDLLTTIQQVSSILNQESTLIDAKSRLISAFQSGKGLIHLTDTAYEILDNPIFIVDSSFKILSMCQSPFLSRPDLESQRELGYMTDNNIESMKKSHVYEKTREKGYPYYSKELDYQGWITALVYIHNIEIAQIGLMEDNHTFHDFDFQIMDFLTKLVSLELQKNDFHKLNQGLMHSIFLSELLENHSSHIQTIGLRLQQLSWKLTSHMYIMTLFDHESGFFDGKAQLISTQLHHIFPNSHWMINDGKIVFLLCLTQDINKQYKDKESLAHYLKINNLAAAFSSSFEQIEETRKYYEQSMKTYEFAMQFPSDNPIHFYSDYVILHMGQLLSTHHKLSDFYHPAIILMRDYDIKHKTNLLKTLEHYLLHIDNPTLTAAKLFIHKNTLFYRINKIKELFCLDLNNGDERLRLQLTLKFMNLE